SDRFDFTANGSGLQYSTTTSQRTRICQLSESTVSTTGEKSAAAKNRSNARARTARTARKIESTGIPFHAQAARVHPFCTFTASPRKSPAGPASDITPPFAKPPYFVAGFFAVVA